MPGFNPGRGTIMSMERILVVEDEMIIALGIQKTLERLGYVVAGVASKGQDAVTMAQELVPDLILMDIILSGDMDGIEAARRIRERTDRPIIYLTANADTATVEQARDTQPYGYLNKPVNERDLMSNIDTALNKYRMETRLRESEEKYRSLLESLNDIVISSDENGVITYVSPQIKEIGGYEESEMIGNNFASYIHPADLGIVMEMFEGARKGERREGVYRVLSKSGGEIWARVSGKPVFVDGHFRGVRGIISDITARRRAEEEVRQKNDELLSTNEELQAIVEELESTNEEFEVQNRELLRAKGVVASHEARLTGILRVAPVGLGIVGPGDKFSWTNTLFQEMTGYPGEQLEGQSPSILFAEGEEARRVQHKLRAQIDRGETGSLETQVKRRDGSSIDVLVRATFLDGEGPDAGSVLAILDVTEQKKAAEALRVSEEKYRHLVENMSDTVWLLDLKTLKYVYNTPSSLNLVGYTPEELNHMTIAQIIKPEDLEMARRVVAEELARDGQPGVDPDRVRRFEIEQTHKNGSRVWSEVTAKILRDASGRPYRALGVSHDITERKKAAEALRSSEEKYRLLANNIIDWLWVIDINTMKFTYASPSVKQLLGYDEKEALATTMFDVLAPESLEKARAVLARERERDREPGVDPERSVTVDLEQVRKDGSIVWTEVKTKFLRDGTGRITGVLGVTRDITQRKRAEQSMAESEKKYRLLADNISDSIWVLDLATLTFTYNSPSSINILGYDEKESFGLKPEQVVTKRSLENAMALLAKELALDGKPGVDPDRTINLELEQIHRDGHIVWTEVNMKPLRNESGAITGILGVSRNVTERRREEELLRMQRDLALALGAATDLAGALCIGLETAIRGAGMDSGGLYLVDPGTGAASLACHEGLGSAFARLVSHYPASSPNARIFKSGKARYGLYPEIGLVMDEVRRAEGLRAIAIIPILYKGETIACMNISSHTADDVSPAARDFLETIAATIGSVIVRLEIQESLKKGEEKFRLMIEESPFPIAVIDDSTGAITYANRSLQETLGYSRAMIPTMDAWWEAGFPDLKYRKAVKGKLVRGVIEARKGKREGLTLEVDIRCADGTFKRIEIHMVYMRELWYFIMNDLTQKKINEEMLLQTEKMLSLGGLAAGMAHEINNPLGIILQGVQGALNRLSPDVKKNREAAARAGTDLEAVLAYLEQREIIEYLQGVRDAGMRAAKIVENMLQFSRRGETVIAPVDLNTLVDRAVEIASYDYDLKKKYDFKKIAIHRSYGRGLPPVHCSETGMEQVILNLLKNSAHALSTIKKKGFRPEIRIATRARGSHVVIDISDNGPGIPADIRRHIFEPFYTTKGASSGTGLGLSVSKHIVVHNHNGSIDVTSEPGQGATFTIKLPLARGGPS
jgi:PAS domain S-box-containing protein